MSVISLEHQPLAILDERVPLASPSTIAEITLPPMDDAAEMPEPSRGRRFAIAAGMLVTSAVFTLAALATESAPASPPTPAVQSGPTSTSFYTRTTRTPDTPTAVPTLTRVR